MNSRALTLAIHLLGSASAAAAVVSLGGCPWFGCADTGWQKARALELGVDVDLHAVTELYEWEDDRSYSQLAVGEAGTVVVWGSDFSSESEMFVDVFSVGEADLNGALDVDGAWWVVGDAGTLAVSGDRGETWDLIDLVDTTADLYAITQVGVELVAVGDGVVLVRGADGTWTPVEPPAGEWGDLRGVHFDGERVYAVGLAGVIWSTDDPSGVWVAEAAGDGSDLWDVGTVFLDTQQTVVVGDNGLLLGHDESGWTRHDTGLTKDLVAQSAGRVLATDGTVYAIEAGGKLSEVGRFEGALDMSSVDFGGLTVVGSDGMAATRDYYQCVGGRPFVVEGTLQTAVLTADDTWCGSSTSPAQAVPPELAVRLAAAWASDGLYEHASVASFARFALEMLALGAPPEIVAAAHQGMADELQHARLCFALARRFGGVAVGPGPMLIDPRALARTGDPVATALALFEEGCVNESVAACEAADAAEECIDGPTREALETIAADERRHATAAWAALRWLVEAFGDRVRGPLRARLRNLGPGMGPDPDDVDTDLALYGRPGAARRAHVRARVVSELVIPLAHALLSPEVVHDLEA